MSRRLKRKVNTVADSGSPHLPVLPQKPKPAISRSEAARALEAVRRRSQRLRRISAGILAIAVIAGFVYLRGRRDAALPGQPVTQMISRHIAVDDPTPVYDTDPPTSGPHVPEAASWGIYTEPMEKPSVVHSLEDGGVVINYRPDLDPATIGQLAAVVNAYASDHLILAPYPGLTKPIVLTAWGRIDQLDTLDEARIRRFADAWRGKDHHVDSGS